MSDISNSAWPEEEERALTLDSGLSEEEKKLVRVIGSRPEQIQQLRDEHQKLLEEITSGGISSHQIGLRRKALYELEREIKKLESETSLPVKALELLREISERTDYKIARIPDDWHIGFPEKAPLSRTNKISRTIGYVGAPILLAASIVPPLLLIPDGAVFYTILTGMGGLITAFVAAAGGEEIDSYRHKVFGGIIPMEKWSEYLQAKESGLFDAFVVATPARADVKSSGSAILCGVVRSNPGKRIPFKQVKDEKGYVTDCDSQIRTIEGHLFEITRWGSDEDSSDSSVSK